jgi:DNA-binding transcriptional LysR family regulator
VSERITSLEKKIGTRLLDRLGRKVIPTAAGELLYKHATLLLEMKETAQLEIEKFLGLEQGEISMGGSTTQVCINRIAHEILKNFKGWEIGRQGSWNAWKHVNFLNRSARKLSSFQAF